jgi:hypothetical protein
MTDADEFTRLLRRLAYAHLASNMALQRVRDMKAAAKVAGPTQIDLTARFPYFRG